MPFAKKNIIREDPRCLSCNTPKPQFVKHILACQTDSIVGSFHTSPSQGCLFRMFPHGRIDKFQGGEKNVCYFES